MSTAASVEAVGALGSELRNPEETWDIMHDILGDGSWEISWEIP